MKWGTRLRIAWAHVTAIFLTFRYSEDEEQEARYEAAIADAKFHIELAALERQIKQRLHKARCHDVALRIEVLWTPYEPGSWRFIAAHGWYAVVRFNFVSEQRKHHMSLIREIDSEEFDVGEYVDGLMKQYSFLRALLSWRDGMIQEKKEGK